MRWAMLVARKGKYKGARVFVRTRRERENKIMDFV
jgi:hypothetical protein